MLHLKEKYAIRNGCEPIFCEIMLYHDVCTTASISKASFFHLVWHTINAINLCDALEAQIPRLDELTLLQACFKSICYSRVMDGCIGALNGYIMRITAPLQDE